MTTPQDDGPIVLPDFDPSTLTPRWDEVKVLPHDARLPRNARLWRRACADGYLSCLVGQAPSGQWVVQVVHVSWNPPDMEQYTVGRPPTIAEVLECINQFTPPGIPYSLGLLSNHPDDMEPFPLVVPVMLSQVAPRIKRPGTRSRLVSV